MSSDQIFIKYKINGPWKQITTEYLLPIQTTKEVLINLCNNEEIESYKDEYLKSITRFQFMDIFIKELNEWKECLIENIEGDKITVLNYNDLKTNEKTYMLY